MFDAFDKHPGDLEKDLSNIKSAINFTHKGDMTHIDFIDTTSTDNTTNSDNTGSTADTSNLTTTQTPVVSTADTQKKPEENTEENLVEKEKTNLKKIDDKQNKDKKDQNKE